MSSIKPQLGKLQPGKFGKKSISSFVDTRCHRQLYISLGNHDPRWFQHPNSITLRSGYSSQTNALTNAGKEYEKEVYTILLDYMSQDLSFQRNPPGYPDILKEVILDKACFIQLYNRVAYNNKVLLLEHQWSMNAEFIQLIFGIEDNTIPTIGNDPAYRYGKTRSIRPDLIVMHKLQTSGGVHEICSDGRLREVSLDERQTRWAINIIDVKHTPSDSIGHRHFAEILFYARSLAFLLEEFDLRDKFFVHANGNGILGKVAVKELASKPWTKLLWTPNATNPSVNENLLYQSFNWLDVYPLFTDFQSAVQSLWNKRDTLFNRNHTEVPLKIQPACGRCPYIDDCVESLTQCSSPIDLRDQTLQTEHWGIELIPGIKPAIVEELNAQQIFTIGDIVSSIQGIDFQNQISPLYGDKDALLMKAQAIQSLTPVLPEDKYRFQSSLLPSNVNMAFILSLETERPNNVVFSYGLRLSITAPVNSAHNSMGLNQAHTSWWNAWINILQQIDFSAYEEAEISSDTLDLINLDPVYAAISAEHFATHHTRYFKPSRKAKTDAEKEQAKEEAKEKRRSMFESIAPDLIRKMFVGLCALKQTENLKRKSKLGIDRLEADVSYYYTEVSGGLSTEEEYALLTSLIDQLYHILNICHATETLVIGEDSYGTHTYDFAGFYWAPQQIDHLFELVNRHYMQLNIEYITKQNTTFERFEQIQDFINPSSSNIRHSQYHKKLYDIQSFLRQGIAFPEIISYSWHDLITIWIPHFQVNRRFWAPLFNFMDFTVWYDFLYAKTIKQKFVEYERICAEHKIKLDAIDVILRAIHMLAKQYDIIPSESQVVATAQFINRSFTKKPLNSIAKLWLGLHELNFSTTQMESDQHRLTWPNFSISKLKAAKVDDLICLEDDPNDLQATRIRFFIPEMSSNVKMSEGDDVQILNLEERNAKTNWKVHSNGSIFKIRRMKWTTTYQSAANHPLQTGFVVEGEMVAAFSYGQSRATEHTCYTLWSAAETPPPDAIFNRLGSSYDATRYVYGIPKDMWGNNLNVLMTRFNFGQSQLAEVVALQSGLRNDTLKTLHGTIVHAPEIYLYWPKLLPALRDQSTVPLQTKLYHPPDTSQENAIHTVMSHPITCIQGPPGTGKSQTVVSLIDEFIRRTNKRPRILVTAFSFSALNVVAEKIVHAWEGDKDNPKQGFPPVREIPMIFTGNVKRFDEIPQQNRSNSPILLRKKGKNKWHAATQWQKNEHPVHEAEISTGYNKSLFDALLPEFGHDIDDGFIVFGNGYGLTALGLPYTGKKDQRLHNHPNDFGFDLIIIDEASQLPTNYLMAALQLVLPFTSTVNAPDSVDASTVNELTLESPPSPDNITRLVLVGDHNQLPPISQVEPPEKLKHLIDSSFFYYLETHLAGTAPAQVSLQYNYRSHADIVTCIKLLGLYNELGPAKNHAANLKRIPLDIPTHIHAPWLRSLLKRECVVNTIVHNSPLDTVFSQTEASITVDVILAYFQLCAPKNTQAEIEFWDQKLGVVSPHNAHGSLIIRGVQEGLTTPHRLTHLNDDDLQEKLVGCITSVDKFQGSARDFIIGTMGISADDQLRSEETFFYDINRFNVLISRAKSKMLLICSRNFAMYTPSDIKLLPIASKIRQYVYDVCQHTGFEDTVVNRSQNVTMELRTMPNSDSSPQIQQIQTKHTNDI